MQPTSPTWSLLSSHGLVLFHIAANPNQTLRQLSDTLGLTEYWVGQIVKDLAAAEMLRVERRGLRNHYQVNPDAHFRHPTLAHIPLAQLLACVVSELKQEDDQPTARQP